MINENIYDPGNLLDSAINFLNLKNDFALACFLEISPTHISNIRNHRIPLGATILLKLHEATGRPVRELRVLMNDHREKFKGYEFK